MIAVLACVMLAATAGCTTSSRDTPKSDPGPTESTRYAANVVHPLGIGSIRFGDTRKELLERKLITSAGPESCGDPSQVYDVPKYADAADLVFNAQDQLAFIWVYTPGVKTPENLSVDSPISAVRKAYPDAEELPANQNSFPALLVKGQKTAYLFLYEPTTATVVKLLAGYTDILREGHTTGITC
jgi:hypothetical protein